MPAILCVIILLTLTNAESNVCDVRLRSTDYFGVLQWNCSGLPSGTRFRVQIRQQGPLDRNPWHDVRQCVGISSNSCDLSEQIFNFTQLVRLGVEEHTGHMQWVRERWCNLPDITDFSAPSLTMRTVEIDGVAGRKHILVKVNFPCIPKALEKHALEDYGGWSDNQTCCPVTQFGYTTTNVMVSLFKKHDPTTRQTRSALVNGDYDDDNSSIDEFTFGGVLPGQEYCVVANFTRSATSQPVCIKLDPQPTDLWPVALGAGGSFLIVVPLTALYLWRRKTKQDRLPRALEGLLEPACGAPALHDGLVRPPVAAEEDDTPSLISLCSCEPSPPTPITHLTPPPPASSPLHQPSQPQYHEYYSNPLTEQPVRGSSSTGSDSGGMVQDILPEDTRVPLLGWGPGGITVPTDGGPQIWEAGVTYFTDTPRIPLSSLRLGLGDMDDVGLYLHGEIMEQSGCMLSTWVEDDGLYHSETVGEGDGHGHISG